ncbi:MAG: 30S ribosomal protein S11 [Opitutales bacterium]
MSSDNDHPQVQADEEKKIPAPAGTAAKQEAATGTDTPVTPEEAPKAGESEDVQAEEQAEEKKSSQPTAKDLLADTLDLGKIRKAKGSKNVHSGICHILATFNNTKVTFTDANGNVISWSSAGKMNFRGSRKSTAYAAQVVCQDAGKVALSHGMKEVTVRVKGPGMGRDSAIRALQSLGLIVNAIVDTTPVPHNGCRPPKRRRV